MDERRLVAGLHSFGAPLIAGVLPDGPTPSWEELLDGLLATGQARYADCVVPLLLVNPANSSLTASWARRTGQEARLLYTAAAALQRELRIRLDLAALPPTVITDEFSGELGLPSVEILHGRLTLAAIDDIPRQGLTVQRAAAYRKMADLMLDVRHAHAPAR